MPSSTAAFVAFRASSIRIFFSLLGLRHRPDFNDRYAVNSLANRLVVTFLIVVARGFYRPERGFLDASLDIRIAGAVDNRRVFFVDDNLLATEILA